MGFDGYWGMSFHPHHLCPFFSFFFLFFAPKYEHRNNPLIDIILIAVLKAAEDNERMVWLEEGGGGRRVERLVSEFRHAPVCLKGHAGKTLDNCIGCSLSNSCHNLSAH